MIDDRSWNLALLFSAIQDFLIEPFLLLCDQSFLERHLVCVFKHVSLHLIAIILIAILPQLILLACQLLQLVVLFVGHPTGLLLQVVSREMVQDLLLELEALVPDQCLLV